MTISDATQSHDDPAREPSDNSEDFAAMFAAQGAPKSLRLHVGDKVTAKVIHVGAEDVFCELSPTQEGSIPRLELTDKEGQLSVKRGDTFEAFVVGTTDGVVLSKKLGRDIIDLDTLMEAAHTQLPVEGLVTGLNKGGLEVALGGGARGFCPLGQVDLGFIPDAQVFVGKTLQFLVKQVGERGRNVLLSRRALLEIEQQAKAKTLRQTLAVGQRLQGKVTRIAEFGAFVDIGGMDGLIPISELSHARVAKVEDVLAVGDEVAVDVLRIEDDPKRPGQMRIALSLKAAQPDPVVAHGGELSEGAQLAGRVTKLEKYGAFVELFPGVEGLVHVSELSNKRVRHPSDVLKVGEAVTVRVLSFDPSQRRVSLSLKSAAAEAPSGASSTLAVGAAVEGAVERIERFGVFLKLDAGPSALLPAAETGTPPGTDLSRAFPVGTRLALEVLAVDERGRIKVSKRAREASEERALVSDYNKSEGASSGFGTLGDLFKGKSPRGKR